MTNPTTLVSTFDNTLDATTAAGATAWGIVTGDEEYTATAPAQFELLSVDSDVISVDPTDIIGPESGSIAFWFMRAADTGSYETLVECGVDGASTDWMKVMVTPSDTLMFYWTSNGDLPQSVTSVETIALDTMYFVCCTWQALVISMSIDNGTPVVGSRDAVAGSWGAGELLLEAV